MVGVQTITLLGMLAAAVTASPTNIKKRASPLPDHPVILRSDLKGVQDGQPSAFKNLILSLTNGSNPEITFISPCQKDSAAGALIKSDSIALTVNNTGAITTKFLGIETAKNPAAQQPVVLLDAPNGQGEFHTDDIELRLGNTNPPFDTWVICPGDSHPTLSWLGAPVSPQYPGGLVSLPNYPCSAVRLFAETFETLQDRASKECPQ
ncbi:MAG: hypothetical protein Q9168_004288 [Polycauliona sp. 1 TL-2023]